MKRITSLLLALFLLLSLVACGAKDAWQEQYDLGIRYLSDGNYQEAIIAFETAIEIEPKRPEAYLGIAEAYIAAGDRDAAIAILKKGLDATGDNKQIKDKLAELEGGANETPLSLMSTMLQRNQVLTYSNIPEVFSNGFDDLGRLLDMQGEKNGWTRERSGSINGAEYSVEVQTCSYGKNTNNWGSYDNIAQSEAPVGSNELLDVDISLWDAPVPIAELGVVKAGWLDIYLGDSYATVLRKLGFENGLEQYKFIQVNIYENGQVKGNAAEASGVTYSDEHATELTPQIYITFYAPGSTAGKCVTFEFHEGDTLNRVLYGNNDLLMTFTTG